VEALWYASTSKLND